MKTIEEAERECYHSNMDEDCNEKYKSNFVKGVEFAQRWIPVEEELPENNFMEYGMQFGIDLLVKFPNGSISLGDRLWNESMQ